MLASSLQPDIALKALLDGKIKSDNGTVKVYEHESLPNNVNADDFITIQRNGIVTSSTRQIVNGTKQSGLFSGNVALSIYCRLYPDNTANVIKSRRLMQDCERLASCRVSDGYYFELDATNPITPPNANTTSGYSVAVLNVAWHTITRESIS